MQKGTRFARAFGNKALNGVIKDSDPVTDEGHLFLMANMSLRSWVFEDGRFYSHFCIDRQQF